MPVMPSFLDYDDGSVDKCLPDWAHFYAELGNVAAKSRTEGFRTVIGIALPTRAYCTTFLALGAILDSATSQGAFLTADAHFDRLCALDLNSRVFLRNGGRKLEGVFRGVTEDGLTEPHVRIQVNARGRSGGGLTHLINLAHAHKVEIAVGVVRKLPKSQAGRRIHFNVEFADRFFAGAIDQLGFESQILCAIVGRANTLVREIKETNLCVYSDAGDEPVRGTLQDVLRIRRFGGERDRFLAEVVPADGDDSEQDVSPPVVVFDGAPGFLKKRSAWPQSNWVVAIDRTEPWFDDAVQVLDTEYLARAEDSGIESMLDDLPEAPPGVEVIGFKRRMP